ncbi:NAD(P)-dependent alcohol dehydrogenase [Microbacterium sp. 18062]|uniref:NAD(P)-dependent alcohol dehydrogenase n=1 Tax=Microbacterium sp. 18062 TaxID=2681410 RepID=UPI001F3F57C0|nr:NAD(P)-dependent alcohol dehydrogenase [Microbacterium sp. 18062]
MTSITAALTRHNGADWELTPADIDDPRAEEVLVRIVATGVCHTDVGVRDGHLPMELPGVLGHEGAGIVERVGSAVSDISVGDHVVLSVGLCGECDHCLRGLPTYCEQGYVRNFSGRRPDGSATLRVDGAEVGGNFFGQSSFATYALADRRSVVPIPADVPLELMGPLGCGLQTGAGTVINALRPEAGSTLVVFGAGAVGMAALMAARIVGCATIVAVDLHRSRLDLALELGATHVVDAHDADVVGAVRAACGGAGADYVVDATGVAPVAAQAVGSLALRGRCALVGVYPPDAELRIPAGALFFGQSVGGVVEGDSVPKVFVRRLVELWRQGRFPFDRLVEYYDFDDINTAVADALSGRVLKPILRIG